MPVVFIHGVATRDGEAYRKDQAARNELIQRLLIEPLGNKDPRYKDLKITSPYWGSSGVVHYWNQATLPDVKLLQDLGPEAAASPRADREMAEVRGIAVPKQGALEALGAEEGPLKRAAKADLRRFLEAVLAPIIFSELRLGAPEDVPLQPGNADPPEVIQGRMEGLLLVALDQAAADPEVRAAVEAAGSDDELMKLSTDAVETRFRKLVDASPEVPSTGIVPGGLEGLGGGWWDTFKDRVGEFFDRAKGAPARAAAISGLDLYRSNLHGNLTRFLGDIFVYLLHRGTVADPGPIVQKVLGEIREAQKAGREDEALVIITHSMGGNILYDLLAAYAPDLKVDVWISAGGQVGQFEEMKLFVTSDVAIKGPTGRAKNLGGRVRYWLNVCDPADILSFLIEPVFADDTDGVKFEDAKFRTGAETLEAHGAYFKRPSFYELVRTKIEGRLP